MARYKADSETVQSPALLTYKLLHANINDGYRVISP